MPHVAIPLSTANHALELIVELIKIVSVILDFRKIQKRNVNVKIINLILNIIIYFR